MSGSIARPHGSVNAWPVRIRRRVFQGDLTRRELIVRSARPDLLDEGEHVFISADPRFCVVLEE